MPYTLVIYHGLLVQKVTQHNTTIKPASGSIDLIKQKGYKDAC